MKRKIILAASLAVGIATGAWLALYVAKGKHTAPVMIPPMLAPAEPVTVYRWQDDKGVSVFSSQPPPAGVAYTTATVDGRLNTMDPVKPAEPPATPTEQKFNPLDAYTPNGMAHLIQQAKQAKKALEQSQQQTIRNIDSQQ